MNKTKIINKINIKAFFSFIFGEIKIQKDGDKENY